VPLKASAEGVSLTVSGPAPDPIASVIVVE
jgi:hypothetical protein